MQSNPTIIILLQYTVRFKHMVYNCSFYLNGIFCHQGTYVHFWENCYKNVPDASNLSKDRWGKQKKTSKYTGGHEVLPTSIQEVTGFYQQVYRTSLGFTNKYTGRHGVLPTSIHEVTGFYQQIFRRSRGFTNIYTGGHGVLPTNIQEVTWFYQQIYRRSQGFTNKYKGVHGVLPTNI